MSYYMAFQPSISEFFILWLSATSFIPIIVRIIALITKAMTVICSVFVFALWSFGSGASLVIARWAFTKCVMLLVYVRAICYLFFLIYSLWFSVRTRILTLLNCHLVLLVGHLWWGEWNSVLGYRVPERYFVSVDCKIEHGYINTITFFHFDLVFLVINY